MSELQRIPKPALGSTGEVHDCWIRGMQLRELFLSLVQISFRESWYCTFYQLLIHLRGQTISVNTWRFSPLRRGMPDIYARCYVVPFVFIFSLMRPHSTVSAIEVVHICRDVAVVFCAMHHRFIHAYAMCLERIDKSLWNTETLTIAYTHHHSTVLCGASKTATRSV